jgi:hypothetical protein
VKPRRTHYSNAVFSLPGGTEDSDLWATRTRDERGTPMIGSTWVPTDAERRAIAAGSNIELTIWGATQPAVAMEVVDYPLGAPPHDAESAQ